MVDEFIKCHNKNEMYEVADFFEWHGKLTGSCGWGRHDFLKKFGISRKDRCNASFFFDLVIKNDPMSECLLSELAAKYSDVEPKFERSERKYETANSDTTV